MHLYLPSLLSSILLILSHSSSLTTATPQVLPKISHNNPTVPLPAIQPTCSNGTAWFMCCENWRGGKDPNHRREATRLSPSVANMDDVLESMCGNGSMGTLRNTQYKVRCPKPGELVCCREEKGSSGESHAVCQVMHDYQPDKLGFGGAGASPELYPKENES